jgi:hypothetical protein
MGRQFHAFRDGSVAPANRTNPAPKILEWSHQPDNWRLRGARLSLRKATEESVALRSVITRERIKRECEALNRLRQVLLADARRAADDPKALRRLSQSVAVFYQRVGKLERFVESAFEDRRVRV